MERNEKTIFALGFFDGVHLGHAVLLRTCRELAAGAHCTAGVVTFGNHPDALVNGTMPRLINTPREREQMLLEQFGMDLVVTLPFDDRMMTMDWKDFLLMLLREKNAAGFVCGDDFRFGYRGAGTPELLEQFCAERELPCRVVSQQSMDGIRVSSSYIRTQLEAGDMATAVRFLGHPHYLTGTVVHGRALGRTLGFPTANLLLPEGIVVPKFGVYACRALVDGHAYPAVTNIGTRPTVEGRSITVEPWILDFSGDLYGREIKLEFHFFLRPERKFDSLEELHEEILRNAQQTRAYLAQAV